MRLYDNDYLVEEGEGTVSECRCGEKTELHTCPYRTEINDDYTTLCGCCESCMNTCAEEI